ncbi:MAG: lytic transglycosylase domain-containing protein [Bacteroidota bacterium]
MLKRKLFRATALSFCLLFITIEDPAQELKVNDTAVIQAAIISSEDPAVANTPAISLNKKAASFVKKYLKEYDITLVAARRRSEAIFSIMDSVFTMFELPVQLKYMAVVESNLKTTVRSHVGAGGLWQLMPFTAKTFGLKITKKYDERFHVYKSTVAAARYMQQLYDEFGDWLLAIAAYNAGSGKVHHAIRLSGSHDFWRLQNFLPAETRNHVKKFIGVNYYFEGQGSLATMTKAETREYNKTLAEFMANNTITNDSTKIAVSEL